MLVGLNGQPLSSYVAPTPNEFTETRVNAELQALDAHLHIRWFPLAAAGPGGRREGRYALCSYWPSIDPRMAEVQQGRMDPKEACDIIGWFTSDMHDATSTPENPEALMQKVLELLYKCDNSRESWKTRMAQCIESNKKRHEKLKAESVEEMVEDAKDMYWHSNRAARVFTSGLKEAVNG